MSRRDIVIAAPNVSNGARNLAEAMYGLVDSNRFCTHWNPNFRANFLADNLVVNWGCGDPSVVLGRRLTPETRVLNRDTSIATNKLSAFGSMRAAGISIPEFTTSRRTAASWINEGSRVYCRTSLRGHSGLDIRIASSREEIVDAPLYTKEVQKRHEFRFHVMGGVVIDGVRKAFRSDVPEGERNRDIMNHAAGTIFVRSGPALEAAAQNQQLLDECVRAVECLGLDFGAVDVMTDRQGNHYILEVNTAPGLEATTLVRYSNALLEVYNQRTPAQWSMGTEIQSNSEEGNITMTVQVRVLQSFNGTTLTRGGIYEGELNPATNTISIRNNQNRLRQYSMSSLQVVSQVEAQNSRPVVAELPTGFDVNSEGNSPSRVVTLSDGSMVNPGGTVIYTGSGSSLLNEGNTYHVVEARKAQDSDVYYLGIEVNGRVNRWQSTNFTNGTRVASNGADPQRSEVPQAPTILTDLAGNTITVGSHVRITTRHGGHGLSANTLAQVTRINVDNNTIAVRAMGATGVVSINARRVVVISSEEFNRIQELTSNSSRNNDVVTIQVGDNNYRVRSVNVSQIQQLLRTLSV